MRVFVVVPVVVTVVFASVASRCLRGLLRGVGGMQVVVIMLLVVVVMFVVCVLVVVVVVCAFTARAGVACRLVYIRSMARVRVVRAELFVVARACTSRLLLARGRRMQGVH